jgi:hypothetical protein
LPSRSTLAVSHGASELTLLGDPLVRLVCALDAILLVLTLGWEQLPDLVDVSHVGTPKISSGGANGLVNLELVIAQTILLIDEEIETVSARRAETLAI